MTISYEAMLQQAIKSLPQGERFTKAYRAFEGDYRIISLDGNGRYRRYTVFLTDDGTVKIKEM